MYLRAPTMRQQQDRRHRALHPTPGLLGPTRRATPAAPVRALAWLRSGVHPCGWADEDVRIGLSGPDFRGESPWPHSADIRSSSGGRLFRSTRPARPYMGSPSAMASAATWFAFGLPRRKPTSSTMTLRPRAFCRSTRRGSARLSGTDGTGRVGSVSSPSEERIPQVVAKLIRRGGACWGDRGVAEEAVVQRRELAINDADARFTQLRRIG